MDKKDYIIETYPRLPLYSMGMFLLIAWGIHPVMSVVCGDCSDNAFNMLNQHWIVILIANGAPITLLIAIYFWRVQSWYKLPIERGDTVKVKHINNKYFIVFQIIGVDYKLISDELNGGHPDKLFMKRKDLELVSRGVFDRYYPQLDELLKTYQIEKPKKNLNREDGVIMVWCLLLKVWVKVFGNDNPPPPPRG